MIRAQEVGRLAMVATARANDNRHRSERAAVPLARVVLAAAGPRPLAGRPPGGARPATAEAPPGRPSSTFGSAWLAPQAALWTAGMGAACRLPPVASGLALYRAWSEVGLAGAASFASVAASGVEMVGVALMGVLAAALPPAGRARAAAER